MADKVIMKPDFDDFMKRREGAHDKQREANGGRVVAFAPHCDSRVLHTAGTCQYCDMPEFNDIRAFRSESKILCTGETPKAGWWPCPAEQARGLKSVNAWGGNTAKPDGCACGWFTDESCPIHQGK